jgi:hypothetical protein
MGLPKETSRTWDQKVDTLSSSQDMRSCFRQ